VCHGEPTSQGKRIAAICFAVARHLAAGTSLLQFSRANSLLFASAEEQRQTAACAMWQGHPELCQFIVFLTVTNMSECFSENAAKMWPFSFIVRCTCWSEHREGREGWR